MEVGVGTSAVSGTKYQVSGFSFHTLCHLRSTNQSPQRPAMKAPVYLKLWDSQSPATWPSYTATESELKFLKPVRRGMFSSFEKPQEHARILPPWDTIGNFVRVIALQAVGIHGRGGEIIGCAFDQIEDGHGEVSARRNHVRVCSARRAVLHVIVGDHLVRAVEPWVQASEIVPVAKEGKGVRAKNTP